MAISSGSVPDDDMVSVVDDDLTALEDDQQSPSSREKARWDVLVVDDDEEVHTSTTFAIEGIEVFGRKIVTHHAYSGDGAVDLLRRGDIDYAVIFLDVVMETDDAGLQAVKTIRGALGLTAVRIILRTGQPGYAPELNVLRDYDINDYRTKSEMTRTRLVSSLYTALRAYTYILGLENSKRGLEKIISASADLYRLRSLVQFGEGILIQIGGLLGIEANGIVVVRRSDRSDDNKNIVSKVLAAAGSFSDCAGLPLESVGSEAVRHLLANALDNHQSVFTDLETVLYFPMTTGDHVAVLIPTGRELDPVDLKLLEVFSANISLGFDNMELLEHISKLAYVDELTRLPNRNGFQREIENAKQLTANTDEHGIINILLLDIDHFQMVNDGLGYSVGDKLLQQVVVSLRLEFSSSTVVSRLSSDQFGLLIWTAEDNGMLLAERVARCFAKPFAIDGYLLATTASGGLVTLNDTSLDSTEVMRQASVALKLAKRTRRGQITRYADAHDSDLRGRLMLVNEIPEAHATHQFLLYYQPQVRLSDGAAIGVEALLRWRRPDGTFVRPDHFIPAAEESGHIVALGEWVLRQACLEHLAWRGTSLAPLRMSVNISLRQIRDRGFRQLAESVLQQTGANPACLEIEITESTAMESDQVLAAIQEMRELGFQVAIDDFGTGHSSLARLQQLPVGTLKIDRAFIDDIDNRADRRSITAMIIKMGHQLGMTVLAEGVETVGQEAVLRELGCDHAQGFLYAKALPSSEVVPWLEQRNASRRG